MLAPARLNSEHLPLLGWPPPEIAFADYGHTAGPPRWGRTNTDRKFSHNSTQPWQWRRRQMLRSLDDEVRAYAAGTLRRFIEGVSSRREGAATPPPTREALFEGSAAPFLKQVWPQERSLNTPAASKAFAHLPAACGEAFAAAVDAVERFLVPFECWSLIEYGLYGDEDGRAKLARINDPQKAAALLRLLDCTVSVTEASVIPHDLSDALG